MPLKHHGIVTKKPPSLLWKPLRIKGWGLFQSTVKIVAAIRDADIQSAKTEALNAVKCINFKDKTDGELAWALVYTAMTEVVVTLLEDVRTRLPAPAFDRIAETAAQADRELETAEISLDQDFFSHPGWSKYANAVTTKFRNWLVAMSIHDTIADHISRQLPRLFTIALDKQWQNDKKILEKLLPENRRTPFTEGVEGDYGWTDYAAWLDEEADRRVFDEDFGLTKVYVPLRAYVEERTHDRRSQRTVGFAEEMLDAWLEKSRSNDPVRVIEGDPGAGKSSLARQYAATRFGRNFGGRRWKVLLSPLHDEAFTVGKSIEEAVTTFTSLVAEYPLISLDREDPSSTLLILDGLDELSRGGQFGRDVIRAFMSQVTALIKAWNHRDDARLLVLICGRPVATGEIKVELRGESAVINLLPFYINNKSVPHWLIEKDNLADPQGLLATDQREEWYDKYASARNLTNGKELYKGIRDRDDLDPISSQPLLNYLIAFLTRETATGELPSNLCGVYENLLFKIWQRGWDRQQVPTIDKLDFEPFCQLLETIALTAWHSGNARSIHVGDVENRLSDQQKIQLATFEKEVKAGVLRLLFAFFLRPGVVERGDQTYEFTHKTFAEYLVARRVIRELQNLANDWKRTGGGHGWKIEDRLRDWAELFGPTALDSDLHEFLKSYIELNSNNIKSSELSTLHWQYVLAQLLNAAVRDGMPMHMMTTKLKPSATFREMNRQAINCEMALINCLNICYDQTNNRMRILALEANPQEWMGGRWLRLMRMYFYRFLDLSNSDWTGRNLHMIDLSGASLDNALLSGTNLTEARFVSANLEMTNFSEADLTAADLSESNLNGANLSKSYLYGAVLVETKMIKSKLNEAKLIRANLSDADLSEADLTEADLTDADLTNADLTGANLREADLVNTKLYSADLGGANLYMADLSGAQLRGADLKGAKLTGANLHSTNLAGAINLTIDQLRLTLNEPILMPDGKPPRKNWRMRKASTHKKADMPKPADGSSLPKAE